MAFSLFLDFLKRKKGPNHVPFAQGDQYSWGQTFPFWNILVTWHNAHFDWTQQQSRLHHQNCGRNTIVKHDRRRLLTDLVLWCPARKVTHTTSRFHVGMMPRIGTHTHTQQLEAESDKSRQITWAQNDHTHCKSLEHDGLMCFKSILNRHTGCSWAAGVKHDTWIQVTSTPALSSCAMRTLWLEHPNQYGPC